MVVINRLGSRRTNLSLIGIHLLEAISSSTSISFSYVNYIGNSINITNTICFEIWREVQIIIGFGKCLRIMIHIIYFSYFVFIPSISILVMQYVQSILS